MKRSIINKSRKSGYGKPPSQKIKMTGTRAASIKARRRESCLLSKVYGDLMPDRPMQIRQMHSLLYMVPRLINNPKLMRHRYNRIMKGETHVGYLD